MTSRTSAFRGFVVKEVRHILRDWQTLLILIGMPVAQVVLFGYAIRSDVRGVRVARARTIEVDATRSLAVQLDGEHAGVTPIRVTVETGALRVLVAPGANPLFATD